MLFAQQAKEIPWVSGQVLFWSSYIFQMCLFCTSAEQEKGFMGVASFLSTSRENVR